MLVEIRGKRSLIVNRILSIFSFYSVEDRRRIFSFLADRFNSVQYRIRLTHLLVRR